MAEEQGTQAPATEVVAPEGTKAFTFNFRTEKLRNEKGEVIGEGKKHPDVKAFLPVPSVTDVVNFLAEGGKAAELVMDSVIDVIYKAARGQINDYRESNPDKQVTPDIFDLSKLEFHYIANQPKSERGGVDISDEAWTAFFEAYKPVIMATGKSEDRVMKHVALFKNQFRTIKNDKPALALLKDQLTLWAANAGEEAMAEHADAYNVLITKADKYLKQEEKNVIDAL